MAATTLMAHSGANRDRAVIWSLLGHGVLVLVVLIGGFVIPRSPPPTQLAIKATVVDPDTLRPSRTAPQPELKPAPEPEPAPEPDPRIEEQRAEEARLAAERQQAEKERLALQKQQQQEQEKQRADEARAKQAEKQRQEKVAAERAKAEAEARAEVERAKAARLKEEAARRQAAEAASKRDIARQLAEEEQLLAAADSGALADYVALIRQKVERNWVRPPGAKPGLECEILVTQIPGGQVTGVRMGACNADDTVRRSIEAAVLRASPLPLPDQAALFERNLRFVFKPEQ